MADLGKQFIGHRYHGRHGHRRMLLEDLLDFKRKYV